MHSMTFQTKDSTITTNDVLGRVAFAAPNEDGGESIKVVGKIEVQAEEAFDASNNATRIVFYLAADGGAATKMTLSSAGTATLTGNLIIADGGSIGSDSDPDAIAIAADGVVSFSATNICPASDDGTALGTGSKRWSDLFLGTGGVVDFGNGDITLTHTADTLTLGGTNGTLISAPASGPSGKTGEVGKFTRTAAGNVWVLIDASAVNDDEQAELRLKSGTDGDSRIYFGDTDDIDRGCICYNHAGEDLKIKTGVSTSDDGSAAAITIDTNQTTEFHGAIRQDHADATDPGNVLTIDCSLSNYFEINHSSGALSAVEFENASEGQRIVLKLTNSYYSGSMSSFWDDVTINGDSSGDVLWAAGIEPSIPAGDTDMYGFIFSSDVKEAYGFIIGQDIKA